MNFAFTTQKLTRNDLLLSCVTVAAVNMLWPSVGVSYSVRDTFSADFLLSNWLILLSLIVVMHFIRQSDHLPTTPRDWRLFGLVVLLAAWPIKHTSTLALSLISASMFYAIWRSKHRDNYMLAAASILFALSFSRLWSPLLLKVFAAYFEQFDVFLLGQLLNTPTNGNTINFVFEPHNRALIVMGCTSFANLSAVVLLWLVVLRLIRITPRFSIELKTVLLLLITAIVINTVRIALMITTKNMYDIVHGSLGTSVTAFLLTLSSIAFAVWGAKREN